MKSIKKLLTIGLATAALSSFSIAAQAWEPTFYAGGNASTSQHKATGSHPFTILSVEGLGGMNLLPYLSVEARLGIGYNEDRLEGENGHDLRENYYASLYLRPNYSNETASIYALLGATSVEISSSDPNLEETDTGFSVGVGVSFVMSKNVDLTAEWKKQIQADDFDIQGGSVGFIYKF